MLCDCSICIAEKKLGSVKTLQNFCKICLFSLQNFAFWMQNLRFFFQKTAGTDRRLTWQVSERTLYLHCPLCKSLERLSIHRSSQKEQTQAVQSSSYIIQHPQSSSTALKSATSSQRKNTGCCGRINVSSFPVPIAAFKISFSFRFLFTGISRTPGEDIKTKEKG